MKVKHVPVAAPAPGEQGRAPGPRGADAPPALPPQIQNFAAARLASRLRREQGLSELLDTEHADDGLPSGDRTKSASAFPPSTPSPFTGSTTEYTFFNLEGASPAR
jgi:hypothetical protein